MTHGERRPLASLRDALAARRPQIERWSTAQIEAWPRARLPAVVPGELIALPLSNAPEAVLALLGLLAARAVCLVVADDATEDEQHRALASAGGGRRAIWTGTELALHGAPHVPAGWAAPAVVLPTSGSTGAAKLVYRSLDSLLLEAERYVAGLGLAAGARVLILAPISHAYALGWLIATVLADCRLVLSPPTHLDAALRYMATGLDWVVLTPALARLLARRRMPADLEPRFGAVVAMAGAGRVDAELDQAFLQRFGVALWRNYGSTETGAVLMGGQGGAEGGVGVPPPGVAARVVASDGAPCAVDEVGRLEVALEDGAWRDTGDLARIDRAGQLAIAGRTSHSVRRGERWVSPAEVERAARSAPGIHGARATGVPGRRTGDDRLVLEVWPDAPVDVDLEALRATLRSALPASHWPDEIRIRGELAYTATDKLRGNPRYRRVAGETLVAAARAYKRAELLFALLDTGVLAALDGAHDVDELAAARGLDPLALEVALAQAERLGLVSSDGAAAPALDSASEHLLALEHRVSTAWTTRDQLAATLRVGVARRPVGDLDALRPVYARALHGDVTRFRVRLGLRRARVGPATRLLEVTSGPGDYLVEALARWPGLEGRLWQLGALHDAAHPALRDAIEAGRIALGPPAADERYAVCVVFNAIHLPDAAAQLARLLRAGPRLVVDDLFLGDDPTSGELGLDWLTHGGISFPTARVLRDRLLALAGTAEIVDIPGSPHARHVIAGRADGE